jgi:hypothetical protein
MQPIHYLEVKTLPSSPVVKTEGNEEGEDRIFDPILIVTHAL